MIQEKANQYPFLLTLIGCSISIYLSIISYSINVVTGVAICIITLVMISSVSLFSLPKIKLFKKENGWEDRVSKEMVKILDRGGNCLISTYDFTWVLDDTSSTAFNKVHEKSSKNEITIILPCNAYSRMNDAHKTVLSRLEQEGAKVIKYPGNGIGKSYTITHFNTADDQEVAFAEKSQEYHKIQFANSKNNKQLLQVFISFTKMITGSDNYTGSGYNPEQ